MYEHMVTMDPPQHTRERALMMRLLTPKRLKDNEAFMRRAGRPADRRVRRRRWPLRVHPAYAQPFAMLVVADVLGVPEEDHERFREGFGLTGTPSATVGAGGEDDVGQNPLSWLDE